MPPPGIVISLSGGVVQAVFAAQPDTVVAIVDWDADLEDHDLPGVVVFKWGGRRVQAFVVQFKVQPLTSLAGSDAEQVIQATTTKSIDSVSN